MRFIAWTLCGVGLFSSVACSSGGTSPQGKNGDDGMMVGSGDGETPGRSSGSPGGTGSGGGLSLGASSDASSGAAVPPSATGSATGGASSSPASGGASSSPASGGASSSSASAGEAAGGAASDEPDVPAPTPNPAQAGVLTAGAWDDNRNFERFLGYRSTWVDLKLPGLLPIDEAELKTAHALWAKPLAAHQKLDISLIIDTTGSMGDEIAYLQAEFLALSSSIAVQYPDAEQRWSLVAYKDDADEYIVRWFDFRSDAEDFRKNLATLSADGGGDLPESPERGFEAAEQLSWRTADTTAKLAFWVADAPHHDDRAQAMAATLRGMQGLGVHVYPVASSGVDDLTELSMRTAAALTGGRYLFLTNDSGVGYDHKEPTIPCYFVTSLRDAIERMVDIELSGVYHEPTTSEIVRTGGDPHDGACKLSSGEDVLVY